MALKMFRLQVIETESFRYVSRQNVLLIRPEITTIVLFGLMGIGFGILGLVGLSGAIIPIICLFALTDMVIIEKKRVRWYRISQDGDIKTTTLDRHNEPTEGSLWRSTNAKEYKNLIMMVRHKPEMALTLQPFAAQKWEQ